MREAGLVVAATLDRVIAAAAPGVSPAQLDEIARESMAEAGATPSFLGYEGFPSAICVSVNEAVIHGIPDGRPLREGDVLSVDCGAIVDGWHSDSARSVVIGAPNPGDAELVQLTEQAMWDGIAALDGARRVDAVAHAVESAVADARERNGAPYGIVEEYVGHGVGSQMHQAPDVPNCVLPGRSARVRPGMCVAVEPMITRGGAEVVVCEDDWTVLTADGTRAAHFEHTVAIREDGLFVLSAPDGGEAELTARGARFAPLAQSAAS